MKNIKGRYRKFLSLFLSLVMVIGMLPVGQITAFASDTIYYIDANGSQQNISTYNTIDASITTAVTWDQEWYAVKGGTEDSPITIPGVTVSGNVHLILLDGCHLTVTGATEKAGICVSGDGNSLTIYAGNTAQTIAGTGTLNAIGGPKGAGIGGGYQGNGSNITINGGTVKATGGNDTEKKGGAGIGGGYHYGTTGGNGSNITINGGTVTATGGAKGAGIGGGYQGNGSGITIKGGTVTATGGEASGYIGAGIGNGRGCTTPASNIKASADRVVKAGDSANPTTVITHEDNTDLSKLDDFKGKQYVTVEEPTYVCQIGSTKYATVQAAVAAVQANETIQMIEDVDLTATIDVETETPFTLDLNGHVLNAGNITATTTQQALACVIYIGNSSGTLTIIDSDSNAAHTDWNNTHPTSAGNADLSGVKGGVLTGGKGRYYDGFKGGAINNNGKLTMDGGTIIGNTADLGAGVYKTTSTGSFTMTGGTITGNQSTADGGGVYNKSGTFTMTGGTITGNTSATNGGGVYNSSTFTMTGGEITDNTGHGVYNASDKLTIGGNAKISGNKVKVTDTDTVIKNLFLPGGRKITISNTTPLAEGASIGVRTEYPPTTITNAPALSTDAQYFHSDDTNYAVVFNTDHLELAAQYTVTFDVGDHGTAPTPEKVVSGGKVTKPTDPTDTEYTFAGWYKEQACTTAWDFERDTVTAATTLYAKWIAGTYHWNTLPSNAYKVTLDKEDLSQGDAIAIAENNIGTPTEETLVIHCWSDKDIGKYGAAKYKDGQWDTGTFSAFLRVFRKQTIPVYIIGTVDKTFDWTSFTANTAAMTFTDDAMTSADAKAIADQMTATSTKKTSDCVVYAAASDAKTYKVLVYDESNEWVENSASLGALKKFLHDGNSVYVIGTVAEGYTVTFETNGGTEIQAQTVAAGGKVTKPENPKKTSYDFTGWYKEATLENKWDFAADTVSADTTLYAGWEEKEIPEYDVSFNMGGHGEQVATQSVAEKKLVERPDDPTEAHWRFVDWYKTSAFETAWNFLTDKVENATTLFAKWVKSDYIVTVIDESREDFYAEDGKEFKLPKNEKENFLYWLDKENETTYKSEETFTVDSDVTVEAVYGKTKKIDGKDRTIVNEATEVGYGSDLPTEGYGKTVLEDIKKTNEILVIRPDVSSHVKSSSLKKYLIDDDAESLVFYMDMKLESIEHSDDESAKNLKLTYSLTPMCKTVGAGGTSAGMPVENEDLSGNIEFKLSVPNNVSQKYGKIEHLNEDGSVKDTQYKEVKSGVDPKGVKYKYVEATAGSFSDFAVSFTDEKPDPVVPASDDDDDRTSSAKPAKTGTWNDPVTNGTWTKGSDGKWMYKTNANFKNTWGYIQYVDRNGITQTGWFWFDANGKMVTGWAKINGNWFYFDETEGGTLGIMKQGWVTWNGGRYYLTETKDSNGGKMLANTTTPDGHVVDETGKMIR